MEPQSNNNYVRDDYPINYVPELDLLDVEQPLLDLSGSGADFGTNNAVRDSDSDTDSMQSFKLWCKEPKSELPTLSINHVNLGANHTASNNQVNRQNGHTIKISSPHKPQNITHDVTTDKADVPPDIDMGFPRLQSLEFENYAQKAKELNVEVEEQSNRPMLDVNYVPSRGEPSLYSNDNSAASRTSILKCNCKKSKCLRLHCVCFGELKRCSPLCNCADCKNDERHEDVRQFVIEKTKLINPLAFKPKIKNFKGMSVNSRGCNCAKNNCLKKYCECYKSGAGCTALCTCVACKNSKDTLTTHEISDIKDKGYRRKHKIVIVEPPLTKRSDSEAELGVGVSFVKHKKCKKADEEDN